MFAKFYSNFPGIEIEFLPYLLEIDKEIDTLGYV